MNFFFNKKVLITGISGFSGCWLTLLLIRLNAKIYGLSINEKRNIFFKILGLKKKISYYNCDINNKNKLHKIINNIKPDIIIHLASQSLVTEAFINPIKTLKTNIIGLTNLFDYFNIKKSKKTLLAIITSDKCYMPNNKINNELSQLGCNEIYSASKASQELVSKAFSKSHFKNNKNVTITTIRAGNIIGAGDYNKGRLMTDIIKSIESNGKLNIRSKESTRPWQSVKHCMFAYLQIIKFVSLKKIKYSNWNVGSKRNIKVNDIVKYLIKTKNLKRSNLSFKKSNLNETLNLRISEKKLINKIKIIKRENVFNIIDEIIKDEKFIKKYKKNSNKQFNYFYEKFKGFSEKI